jgi:hypothetical protein
MTWPSFGLAPVHEETVAKTSHHGQDQHSVVIAHRATIIIMEDIQALMYAVFNAPVLAIEP